MLLVWISLRNFSDFLRPVLGCPDVEAPSGGWAFRNDETTATFGCAEPTTSSKTWQLVCLGHSWRGVMHNCTRASDCECSCNQRWIYLSFIFHICYYYNLCAFVHRRAFWGISGWKWCTTALEHPIVSVLVIRDRWLFYEVTFHESWVLWRGSQLKAVVGDIWKIILHLTTFSGPLVCDVTHM